jgi:NAD(P)-dependent dehydrogenase (short-subunit alcohol dehydrogenase family)
MRLQGRTVLVTGGASGIGAACAARYEAEGARVFVADIAPRPGQIAFDVGNALAWDGLLADLPPLDVLHLNAGRFTPGRPNPAPQPPAPLLDISDQGWAGIKSVNIDGVFYGARSVLPAMVQRGAGDIIVTASLAGLVGPPGDIAYCMTKHAVVGMVRAVGLALNGTNVCISALCPGTVDTPMVSPDLQAILRQFRAPIATPERVADAAMTALTERANAALWIVWGDDIRRHQEPDLGLGPLTPPAEAVEAAAT